MLIANIEGRIIAKCSDIHQNVHCPKFNIKKSRDILKKRDFKSLGLGMSRLGLGDFGRDSSSNFASFIARKRSLPFLAQWLCNALKYFAAV